MPRLVHPLGLLTWHRCKRSGHDATAEERDNGNKDDPELHGFVDGGFATALCANSVVIEVSDAVYVRGKRNYISRFYIVR